MPSSRSPSSKGGFPALGLSDTLLSAVTALGYEEPTPVQRATIPILLDGRDLLAQAATGTGKTAAFALPMIQRVTERDPRPADKKQRAAAPTGGLVLVPTRELAMQVSEAIHKYADGTGVIVVPLYGGAGMDQQIRALARGAHIVVATPGRALDHIRRKTLRLDGIHVLVLDEADEMLDMGFAEDIEQILDATPATRQTALFSATLPARILKIAERHLRTPERVNIAADKSAAGALPRVRQIAYVVRRDQKPAALDRILDMEHPRTAIVFCRTRLAVDTLVETLNAHGYRAEALHGGMQQRQRDAVMNRVRAGKTDLLMATDVAARGLDIEHVSHVVNYDLPADPESYVHRIGRTGRAGRIGTAITLADPREHRLLRTIERFTKQKIDVHPVPTVKDLRARRLELLTATLRERLAAGDFDDDAHRGHGAGRRVRRDGHRGGGGEDGARRDRRRRRGGRDRRSAVRAVRAGRARRARPWPRRRSGARRGGARVLRRRQEGRYQARRSRGRHRRRERRAVERHRRDSHRRELLGGRSAGGSRRRDHRGRRGRNAAR